MPRMRETLWGVVSPAGLYMRLAFSRTVAIDEYLDQFRLQLPGESRTKAWSRCYRQGDRVARIKLDYQVPAEPSTKRRKR